MNLRKPSEAGRPVIGTSEEEILTGRNLPVCLYTDRLFLDIQRVRLFQNYYILGLWP